MNDAKWNDSAGRAADARPAESAGEGGTEELEGPGLHDQGTLAARGEGGVEHVERVHRRDALDQVGLTHAVQGGHREATRVDLAAFLHERLELVVEVHVTG